MPRVERPPFSIYYEVEGADEGRPLVFLAGLGEQLGSVEYPDEQRALLRDAGFRLIRMDTRDAGLSVPYPELPPPDVQGIAARRVAPAYTQRDIAADVVAILDQEEIGAANVVGASRGGFDARWLAIDYPDRVSSLTVVMSGSGARPDEDGPQNDLEVLWRLFELGERRDELAAVDTMVDFWRWMWGNGYPFPEAWVRERVSFAYDRSYRPEGILRQMTSIVPDASLWQRQSEIDCPTLVMHGGEDPLWGLDHAEATASQIRGAQLWADPQMGHIMHPEQWAEMAARMASIAG